MKKYNKLSTLRNIFLLAVLLAGGLQTTALALNNTYDLDFYSGNGIYWYVPGAANQCVVSPGAALGPSSVTTGNGANGNRDYKDRQIISDDQLEKIKEYQPAYESAAKQTKIPWQVFAIIHIRESNLSKSNPSNGQGIYQDFELGGAPPGNEIYPPGTVSDGEFLRQTVYAGKILQQKAGSSLDLVEKGDPDAIKDLFFRYNGQAAAYIQQAIDLGFHRGYEGSPYVMNKADAKRDPESAKKNTWGQIKVDGGGLEYPAGNDYGAWVMYSALAGVTPSTGTNGGKNSSTACAGLSAGTRLGDLVVYYQDEEPWANMPYGDTILRCGCGPTSMAMAIATLNNDDNITPETMANFFVDNGYLHAGCGTQFTGYGDTVAFSNVSLKLGVNNTDIGTDISKAAEALKRNSLVYVSATGCPFACAGGHILLLRGVTDDGKFLVADPNKNWGEREDTPWPDSDKTHYEEGFPISNAADSGINYMWEIRK
jgi:hypothetical protein